MIGIALVFILLVLQMNQERRDPTWSRDAFVGCQHNLGYLRSALESYQRDHHHLPARLEELQAHYLDSPARLVCPLCAPGSATTYQYTPNAKEPTSPLITCRNHGQGPLFLQYNGQINLPTIAEGRVGKQRETK